jgi:hypothetical protein
MKLSSSPRETQRLERRSLEQSYFGENGREGKRVSDYFFRYSIPSILLFSRKEKQWKRSLPLPPILWF